MPQSRQRPRERRSALRDACLSRCFFLCSSLRTVLCWWSFPWLTLSPTSLRRTSISSESSIRGRGILPIAIRTFSAFSRSFVRCFSAQSRHLICPVIASSGQCLQRPSPLRRQNRSLARSRMRSRFCSSVRRGLGTLMALFLGRVCFGLAGLVPLGRDARLRFVAGSMLEMEGVCKKLCFSIVHPHALF